MAKATEFNAPLFLTLISFVLSVSAQTTTEPLCKNTGPTCLQVEDCANINATYATFQWCGGCRASVTCNDQVGTIHPLLNPLYPFWDDNAKTALALSTTCTECFFACPPLSEPPPDGAAPACTSTGPTCISGTTFCNGVFSPRLFQICDNCRSFVNCRGLGQIHTVELCPPNTIWDDWEKNCTAVSTTCKECYTYCNETFPEPTTLPQTTILPTTLPLTTILPTTLPPTSEAVTTLNGAELSTQNSDAAPAVTLSSTRLGFISAMWCLAAVWSCFESVDLIYC